MTVMIIYWVVICTHLAIATILDYGMHTCTNIHMIAKELGVQNTYS